jgi:hypothetical protein
MADKEGMTTTGDDVFVPWEVHDKFDAGNTVYSRYYHFFREGELEALCERASAKINDELIRRREQAEASSSSSQQPCCPGAAASAGRGSTAVVRLVIESSYFDKENWCVVLCRSFASS